MQTCSRCRVPLVKLGGYRWYCPVCHRTTEERPKVLECSSAGDRRFSAFYARVQLAGQVQSIEDWYQLSKRWEGEPAPTDWRQAKGRYPDYLEILGVRVPVALMSAWYDYLWFVYLSRSPHLVAHASQFDHFTDRYARRGGVSQARSIRTYVKDGPQAIIGRPDVQALLQTLKEAGVDLSG